MKGLARRIVHGRTRMLTFATLAVHGRMQMVAGGLEPELLRLPLAPPLGLLETARDGTEQEPDECRPADLLDDVGVQPALVEAVAAAELRHALHLVAVVRHEDEESRVMLLPAVGVEREVERRAAPAERSRKEPEERDQPVPGLPRRVMDEARIDPERDVVQEPTVAG
jgi:hypothetical protein